MKPRFKLTILLLLILCNAIAQNRFRYQTFTDSVVKDGFYQINLLPSITAKCKPALDDIRVMTFDDKQVPYLIKNNERNYIEKELINLKTIDSVVTNNSVTELIIENSTDNVTNTIDNLALIFQNSLVSRSINLSKSNDKKHWYVIGEFIELKNQQYANSANIIQTIPLPITQVRYLKIKFNLKQQEPIQIKQVGTYKYLDENINYFRLPSPKISQHDSSDKWSYITLSFPEKVSLDKIQLFISGPKFYQRLAYLSYQTRQHSCVECGEIISSKKDNIYVAQLGSLKFFDILIENNDNLPLHIDSIKAYQNAKILFAYLKAGQKYKLAFGNDSLAPPVYDISAFSDSIKNAALLPTNEITENHFSKESIKTTDSFNNKIWLWTAIIVVLLLLLYFTSNMLKQINKKV